MNILKSVLAAAFVSEIGYVVSILLIIALRFPPKANTATGLSIVFYIAKSPLALLIGFACFLISLWLFLRK